MIARKVETQKHRHRSCRDSRRQVEEQIHRRGPVAVTEAQTGLSPDGAACQGGAVLFLEPDIGIGPGAGHAAVDVRLEQLQDLTPALLPPLRRRRHPVATAIDQRIGQFIVGDQSFVVVGLHRYFGGLRVKPACRGPTHQRHTPSKGSAP